jgi:hypothetical protein
VTTELQATAGGIVARALDGAVERVRARRVAYADSHKKEFVPEGSGFEASKDSAGRSRMARSCYMKALCSITDVQTLLDTTSAATAPPLLRNLQVRRDRGRHSTSASLTHGGGRFSAADLL